MIKGKRSAEDFCWPFSQASGIRAAVADDLQNIRERRRKRQWRETAEQTICRNESVEPVYMEGG